VPVEPRDVLTNGVAEREGEVSGVVDYVALVRFPLRARYGPRRVNGRVDSLQKSGHVMRSPPFGFSTR
jgi:hypothetical protein